MKRTLHLLALTALLFAANAGARTPSVAEPPEPAEAGAKPAEAEAADPFLPPASPEELDALRKLPPPEGNDPKLRRAPKLPDLGTASQRARLLVDALRTNQPDLALPFFLPQQPFRRIKGVRDPDRIYRRLIRIYRKDIRALRGRLKAPDTLEFVSFTLGRGRSWIPRGKEANRLPYWARYKGKLRVRDGGKERVLNVRVMISWEGEWYVVHLTNK